MLDVSIHTTDVLHDSGDFLVVPYKTKITPRYLVNLLLCDNLILHDKHIQNYTIRISIKCRYIRYVFTGLRMRVRIYVPTYPYVYY